MDHRADDTSRRRHRHVTPSGGLTDLVWSDALRKFRPDGLSFQS